LKRSLAFLFIIILANYYQSCDEVVAPKNRVVVIQPLGEVNAAIVNTVYEKIRHHHSYVILKKTIALPASTYYPLHKRYRADKLIDFLKQFGSLDTVIVGLTMSDISHTKGNIEDYGIMGLGFCPGRACVISTYRLRKKSIEDQIGKLALHELGHTQGLPHCPDPKCIMRDAEGGNHYDEFNDFCAKCKLFLTSKGWKV
jgi:archaemetzincin